MSKFLVFYIIFGLIGIAGCGYGYAAFSTDLIFSGEATVKPDTDVEITKVWANWSSNGANEGYNSKHTTRTVSLYPQVPTSGGEIVYWVTTCNHSTTQTYELTSMVEQIKTMQGMQIIYADFEVGDMARIGTLLEPGECKNGRIDTYRDGNNPGSNAIASLQLDFEWSLYDPTPFSIEYMQDMTSAECARVTPRQEKMLIDKRDGKKYWVVKAQDGNCWMAQNLALDLHPSTPLTPADSDVTSDWYPGSDTNAFHYSTTNYLNDNSRWLSWNLGDNLMLAKPRAADSGICVRYGSLGSAIWSENLVQVCGQTAVLDVTGWSPTWKMQIATTTWPNTNYFGPSDTGWAAANPVTKEYDQHYMMGNYYQWLTATAGSGTGLKTNGMNAANSICPKGWQLPTSPSGSINSSKSYANLYRAYGLIDDVSQISGTTSEKNGYGIFWAPFYAVPSGYVATYNGQLERFMDWGGGWSSTVWGQDYSYNLAHMPTLTLRAQGGPNEWQLGMPVRCVAR